MRRVWSLAAVLFALLAIAGCGGSDSSSGSSEASTAGDGEALTKDEFIERADAICEDRGPERKALQAEFAELADEINARKDAAREELADLLAEAAESGDQEFEELRALVPPADDAAIIDSMLSNAGGQEALTRAEVDALRRTDYEAFTEVAERAAKLQARANRVAQEYGLKVCGSEGKP